MTQVRASFERMVLGLPHNAQDYPAVELAAELAECLGLQFLGTFIVEPAIFELGRISGSLELKSVTAGWQPIESGSFERDYREAVDAARRQFAAVARRLKLDAAFRIERGLTAEIVASLAQDSDIMVMIEPRNPADRITHQFLGLMEAAFRTSSSIMLLPRRVLRKEGSIVVVVDDVRDLTAIDVAAEIAWAMHESLVIINATGQPTGDFAAAVSRPVKMRVISAPLHGLAMHEQVSAGLVGIRERMIVACRTALDCDQSRLLAGMRGVPLLMTGRGRALST